MNLYVHLGTFKSALGVASDTDNAEMLRCLAAVSREVDDLCLRHFYTAISTRYFAPEYADFCYVDDLLSVTGLHTDTSDDSSYATSWAADTDYLLDPANRWPKGVIRRARNTAKYFSGTERFLRIAGTFGYGDGKGSNPWKLMSVTGTLADASDTSLTLSAAGSVHPGMTLKLGTEQMFVEAVSTTTATVERGLNGTTAASQAGVAVYQAQYPEQVTATVLQVASATWNLRSKQGLKDVMIGEYRETLLWDNRVREQMDSMLGRMKRPFMAVIGSS